MKPEISVFIPVYRESTLLPKMLDDLLDQDVEKEIFVIIDEPSENSLQIVKKFGGEVRFILNWERVGKVNALNDAVKKSSGFILLFLDSDVEVPSESHFLKRIVEEMKDVDVLDIKKEVVKESFLSRMTYYEYVGFNVSGWLMAKLMKKGPAVNGAAFAVKRSVFNFIGGFRKVMSEDLDFATRAFLKGYRFSYLEDVNVYCHVKSSWGDWIKQRRRWTIGAALWIREWGRALLKRCAGKLHALIPLLFLLFPSSAILILNLFLPRLLIYSMISILFLFLAVKFNFALPVLLLTHLGLNFVENLSISLSMFLIFALSYFLFSRKLAFQFRIHEFLFYYFFYSLLNILLVIVGIIEVFALKKRTVSDWKT
ncbi:glycosyltransferase family 2 protein [Candidatus Bathyarchaeota archaeon]|nr:glycosyltransferase family 2 protein [Candidatus Bathyarchaeota archaeon]